MDPQDRLLDLIVAAHRAALNGAAGRDQAIAQAMDAGISGYAIAQALRAAFGPNGLSQVTVRAIARRHKEKKS